MENFTPRIRRQPLYHDILPTSPNGERVSSGAGMAKRPHSAASALRDDVGPLMYFGPDGLPEKTTGQCEVGRNLRRSSLANRESKPEESEPLHPFWSRHPKRSHQLSNSNSLSIVGKENAGPAPPLHSGKRHVPEPRETEPRPQSVGMTRCEARYRQTNDSEGWATLTDLSPFALPTTSQAFAKTGIEGPQPEEQEEQTKRSAAASSQRVRSLRTLLSQYAAQRKGGAALLWMNVIRGQLAPAPLSPTEMQDVLKDTFHPACFPLPKPTGDTATILQVRFQFSYVLNTPIGPHDLATLLGVDKHVSSTEEIETIPVRFSTFNDKIVGLL